MVALTKSEDIYSSTMNLAANFIQREHRHCKDDILKLIDNVAEKKNLSESTKEGRAKLKDAIERRLIVK